MFFLGEIFVDLALPESPMASAHCGSCSACIEICPTRAIVAPYTLDARRCISYLTIEHRGPIPIELRAAIGNRVYGCDDCQLACPWNKFARTSPLADFDVRPALDAPALLDLWSWDEETFLRTTEGSPIRRIGFERWQRNLAVALGNALAATGDDAVAEALVARRDGASELVREHIDWALRQSGRVPSSAASGSRAPVVAAHAPKPA
jgi:epoxyqueuosine reductase